MKMFGLIEKWDTIAFMIYNFFARIRFHLVDKFKYSKYLAKTATLKNKHKGQRCFIVLNGPSIVNIDLSIITNEITICTNLFYKTEYYNVVNPNYYLIWDMEIVKVDDGRVIDDLFNYDTKYIVNKKMMPLLSEVQSKKAYPVYGQHMPTNNKIRDNIAGFSSSFTNVSSFAILSAIYMGFKDIYIIGLDFAPGMLTHTYKKVKLEEDVEKQLLQDKNYICGWHWWYYLAHLQNYYLSNYAKKHGINIYNVNPDSHVRMFDFVDYKAIFNK